MNTCWVDLKVCTIFRSLSSLIWDCKTHGHLGGMQSSLGHLVRSGSTLLENLIQFLFIFSHFVVSCLDGFQVVDNRICQEWLEGTPIKVLDFQNNVLLGSTRLHCRINVQQICRFRSLLSHSIPSKISVLHLLILSRITFGGSKTLILDPSLASLLDILLVPSTSSNIKSRTRQPPLRFGVRLSRHTLSKYSW
jgi:hypothetical protein